MDASRASDVILSARDVTFSYPGAPEAIRDISFDLRQGEVVAIVGPSGCGKSTLLRTLAGLIRPTRGSVWHAAAPKDDRPPLTMMFQQETLLPWLRVDANARIYYRFNRRSRSPEAAERTGDLLRSVGLADDVRKFTGQLSGGMRRRVAFVAAVAPLPRILLLDEPFSALDEPTRLSVHQDVLHVLRRYGMGCCLVTHDLGEAISLADRVLVLSAGPGHVQQVFDVDLGAQRDMFSIREQPRFLELYGEVWKCLRSQLANRDLPTEIAL